MAPLFQGSDRDANKDVYIIYFHALPLQCIWQLLFAVQVYKSHLTQHAVIYDTFVDIHGCDDRQGHRV